MVINWQPLQLLSVGRVVFYHVDKEPKTLGGREGGERGRRGREEILRRGGIRKDVRAGRGREEGGGRGREGGDIEERGEG